MTFAIGAAVLGAIALAAGAALQERAAVRAPGARIGRLGLFLHLIRNPRWVGGGVVTLLGGFAHMWALSRAPLTLVQPIGVCGLLFAIALAAVLAKRRLNRGEVTGSLLVMAGLAGLVWLLPDDVTAPDLSAGGSIAMCAAVAVAMAAGLFGAYRTSGATRTCFLAAAGGLGFGGVSAIVRVVGSAAATDITAVLHWLTPVAVVIGLFGWLFVQNAYRTDQFALAYATMLIIDPLAGAGIGVVFLGEPLPGSWLPLAGVLAAGVLIAAGTLLLARSPASGTARAAPETVPPRGAGQQAKPATRALTVP